MQIGKAVKMTGGRLLDIALLLEEIQYHGGAKKQPVVSRSIAEAEYRAMSVCLSEMLWVSNLVSELKLKEGPLKLWCDNRSAINIANNPVQHDRTKHVEIDRFFIK